MDKDRGQAGFTLIEILIVVAILGILVATVVPNLAGFLGRGASEAYNTARNTIQAASDAYYTRPGVSPRQFPTLNGLGNDTEPPYVTSTNVISFTALISANLIREKPASAGTKNDGGTGTYSWFVLGNGIVSSTPAYTGAYP